MLGLDLYDGCSLSGKWWWDDRIDVCKVWGWNGGGVYNIDGFIVGDIIVRNWNDGRGQ